MGLPQAAEKDLIQSIDSDVTNMNTISKSSLFHGNLNILLHVLDIIIKKIYVKIIIAQNDTDLSFIKLYINVLKCYAFVNFKVNTGQISVILSYYDFYINFIYYLVQDEDI